MSVAAVAVPVAVGRNSLNSHDFGYGALLLLPSEFLCSGQSMFARSKLSGIDGTAPPGVEPTAQFDSTQETSPSRDSSFSCRVAVLSR